MALLTMDPVSLTLGILPIFLSALEGFSILRAKLKILRHYAREVKRVRRKLTVQTGIFEDEVHFLLMEILEPRMVQSMMEDGTHAQWTVPDVETLLRSHLGAAKYPQYIETTQEVEVTIKGIQARLAFFADPGEKVNLPVRSQEPHLRKG